MTGLVKICGLSTQETVKAALAAGADMIGFVFFPRSPRHVSPGQAAALAVAARGRATIVALTVDADEALLDAIVDMVRPDLLQLHGAETPERARAVARRLGRPVMKAVGVASQAEARQAVTAFGGTADRLLLDAKPPPGAALPGGNGQAFDWTILHGLDLPIPLMLSGGLTASTVADAIRISGTSAVDVSSGVETAPGRKDAGLIAAFVAAARRAFEAPAGGVDGQAR